MSDDKIMVVEYWHKNGDEQKLVLLSDYVKLQSQLASVKAENEKLREALEHYTDSCYDGHDYSAKEISKYAREALASLKSGKE
jgi:cell division protein FtsB